MEGKTGRSRFLSRIQGSGRSPPGQPTTWASRSEETHSSVLGEAQRAVLAPAALPCGTGCRGPSGLGAADSLWDPLAEGTGPCNRAMVVGRSQESRGGDTEGLGTQGQAGHTAPGAQEGASPGPRPRGHPPTALLLLRSPPTLTSPTHPAVGPAQTPRSRATPPSPRGQLAGIGRGVWARRGRLASCKGGL